MGNPNKGRTKDALIKEIRDSSIGYYIAQFGNQQWILDAIAEAIRPHGYEVGLK